MYGWVYQKRYIKLSKSPYQYKVQSFLFLLYKFFVVYEYN